MANQTNSFSVTGEASGLARILTITYEAKSLAVDLEQAEISTKILAEYRALADSGPDCVAMLRVSVATSVVIYALYDLYNECNKIGGRLFIVNYPKEYIDALSSLAFTALPGFVLADSLKGALALIGGG